VVLLDVIVVDVDVVVVGAGGPQVSQRTGQPFVMPGNSPQNAATPVHVAGSSGTPLHNSAGSTVVVVVVDIVVDVVVVFVVAVAVMVAGQRDGSRTESSTLHLKGVLGSVGKAVAFMAVEKTAHNANKCTVLR